MLLRASDGAEAVLCSHPYERMLGVSMGHGVRTIFGRKAWHPLANSRTPEWRVMHFCPREDVASVCWGDRDIILRSSSSREQERAPPLPPTLVFAIPMQAARGMVGLVLPGREAGSPEHAVLENACDGSWSTGPASETGGGVRHSRTVRR